MKKKEKISNVWNKTYLGPYLCIVVKEKSCNIMEVKLDIHMNVVEEFLMKKAVQVQGSLG